MMKKKLILIISCILLIVGVVGVIAISVLPDLPQNPSKEKLVSFFNKNRNTFNKVAVYLIGIEEDISFNKKDGDDIESIGRIVTKDGVKSFVVGNEVKDDVKKLIYKYDFMDIYKEGQYVYFVKFTGFQWHKSLVYSKYGKAPPLNKKRDFADIGNSWYYYEGE